MKQVAFIVSLLIFIFGIWAIFTNQQQNYKDTVFETCSGIYSGNSASDAIDRASCNERNQGDNGTVPLVAIILGGIGMATTYKSLSDTKDKKDKTE